jgi:hypothetical protein
MALNDLGISILLILKYIINLHAMQWIQEILYERKIEYGKKGKSMSTILDFHCLWILNFNFETAKPKMMIINRSH